MSAVVFIVLFVCHNKFPHLNCRVKAESKNLTMSGKYLLSFEKAVTFRNWTFNGLTLLLLLLTYYTAQTFTLASLSLPTSFPAIAESFKELSSGCSPTAKVKSCIYMYWHSPTFGCQHFTINSRFRLIVTTSHPVKTVREWNYFGSIHETLPHRLLNIKNLKKRSAFGCLRSTSA